MGLEKASDFTSETCSLLITELGDNESRDSSSSAAFCLLFFPETEICHMGSVGGSVYVEEEKRSVGGGREGNKVVRVAFFNRERRSGLEAEEPILSKNTSMLYERSKNIIR